MSKIATYGFSALVAAIGGTLLTFRIPTVSAIGVMLIIGAIITAVLAASKPEEDVRSRHIAQD